MRGLGVALIAAIFIGGCSSNATSISSHFETNLTGLPHFQVVRTLKGRLVQLGKGGRLLVCDGWGNTQWGHSGLDLASEPLFNAEPQNTGLGRLTFISGSKPRSLKGLVFLNSSGEPDFFLSKKGIQISDGGKQVGLAPMNVVSDRFRYYQSKDGVYCCNRKGGQFRRIISGRVTRPIFAQNDTLFCTEDVERDHIRIHRVGPNTTEKVVYEGADRTVVSMGPRGEVGVRIGDEFGVWDTKGVTQELKNSLYWLSFFRSKSGKDFPVGFAQGVQKGEKLLCPVFWTDEGKPVRLFDLCSGLQTTFIPIDRYEGGIFLTSDDGYIAFEEFGQKLPDPNENSRSFTSSNGPDYGPISMIYLLKEVP